MEVHHQPNGEFTRALLVEVFERSAEAGELGFAAVANALRIPRHEIGHPGVGDVHALDRARGGDGLDTRLFLQGAEQLWKLVAVARFGAGRRVDPAQQVDDVTLGRYRACLLV